MRKLLTLYIFLLFAVSVNAMGILSPKTNDAGLLTGRARIEEQKKLNQSLNSEIANLRQRVENTQRDVGQLNSQVGLLNETRQNSGVQIFAGDMGTISLGILAVAVVVSLGWWRAKHQENKAMEAGAILLKSTSPEDAIERAKGTSVEKQVKEIANK